MMMMMMMTEMGTDMEMDTVIDSHLNAGPRRNRRTRGWTMIEFLVALAIAMIVLAVAATLAMFGARSFAAMVNYSDLDQKSRQSLDTMILEMRQSTRVIAVHTALPTKYLWLYNAEQNRTNKFTWYSTNGTVVFEKTGLPAQPARTMLSGCDDWEFALYSRDPVFTNSSVKFKVATNMSDCKLIDMSWKCSRKIIGQKLNTESVQTAQIVLRNKVK